jgi:hypothetical protein
MARAGKGHVFISYVREDADKVTRLEHLLRDAGIEVWRDTTALWPGMDWRSEIRRAITDDALVFLACISDTSVNRVKSGQNEELVLAVEELRKRRPDQPWLIPVLFDKVDVPDLDVGGGRTLRSYQWIDLSGDNWDQAGRLVASVVRILEPSAPESQPPSAPRNLEIEIKAALRDPGGDIAYHDLIMGIAATAAGQLNDDARFPNTSNELSGPAAQAGLRVASLVNQYMEVLKDPIQVMITSGQWAAGTNLRHLTHFVERLGPSSPDGTGMVVLRSLRWFPALPVLYAGALAANATSNYDALRAITIDPGVRDFHDGKVPLITRSHPWRPFQQFELVPQILALQAAGEEVTPETCDELRTGRRGKRYTPVSDFLHDTLRARFRPVVPDDEDYAELFDRTELLLDLIGFDLADQMSGERIYVDGPRFGRSTWRHRYINNDSGPEHRILREAQAAGDNWEPLHAGLFGRSSARAVAAIERLVPQFAKARSRRW